MSELTMDQQIEVVKSKQILENGVVVSNIIELVVNVITKVAGKDIADSVDGNTINRNILSNLVARKLKDKVLGE